ncbi:MAG: hypothetical protein ACRDT0_00795 [Pseudonocardiaceae bacterium]
MRDVMVRDLVRVGLLPVGTMLTCTRNGHFLTAVAISGALVVDGHRQWFEHPSPAVSIPSGAISSNGWLDWKLPDDHPLDDLRQRYWRGDY